MSDVFKQWLSNELARRGLSQVDLARQIGLSSSYVSQVISGAKPASANFCNKVAAALDIPPARVLALAGILPEPPPASTPGPITSEIMQLVEQMPPEKRKQILDFARYIATQPGNR